MKMFNVFELNVCVLIWNLVEVGLMWFDLYGYCS